MKQIVYVVTSGQYSDYGIDALFSTREKAERYTKECWTDTYDSPTIREWTLDEHDGKIARTRWCTRIDMESGAILHSWNYMDIAEPEARTVEPELTDYRNHQPSVHHESFGKLVGSVYSYVSAEHSLKLAAEFRQNYLRERSLA